MATYRDLISAQKRKGHLQAYSGMVVFIAGGLLASWHPTLLVLGLAGFVWALVGIWTLIQRVRCPNCDAKLGYATLTPGGPFSVSPRIRHCPQCGVALDTPCPDPDKPST